MCAFESICGTCMSTAIAACCQPISECTMQRWNVFSVFNVWAWPRPASHHNLHLQLWLGCFDSCELLRFYGLLSFCSFQTALFLYKMSRAKARDPDYSVDALCQNLSRPLGPTSIWNNRASIHLAIIDQFWLAFLMVWEQKGLQCVRGANIFFFHHLLAFLYD